MRASKTLFGCELWNSLTSSDVQQLEVAHHFCLKRVQGLPFLTRSDMVKGLSGSISLKAYIDTQKLTFYGLLCRSSAQGIVRKLLLIRHYQHKNSQNLTLGFVPDVMRILTKYKLDAYASPFTSDTFPSKHQWKSLCKTALRNHETSLWKARLDTSRDFELFKQIHPQMRLSSIWYVARVRPQSLALMKLLACLCCQRLRNSPSSVTDVIFHATIRLSTPCLSVP